MTMRRYPTPRSQRPDLLVRPPWRRDAPDEGWAARFVDPVAPLAELADLLDRELITRAEYERQKAKVLGGATPSDAEAPPAPCAGRWPPPRRATRRPACGRSSSDGT